MPTKQYGPACRYLDGDKCEAFECWYKDRDCPAKDKDGNPNYDEEDENGRY